MRRATIALLLIPSLALGEAPRRADLEPRLRAMTVPALLEEYETIDRSRPGLGGPLAVMGIGFGLALFGLAISGATFTTTVNGVKTTQRASSGWFPWTVLGVGLAALAGGGAWLFFNVRRRFAVGETLDLVQAELDARERQAAEVSRPELLALLAAPTQAPPATGGLVVMVSDVRGPVPRAQVLAQGRAWACDDRGTVSLEGLPPGPVVLSVSAPGHVSAEEAASVVAGTRTAVQLQLASDRERAQARLAGVVRSGSSGAPVSAQLELVELKLRVAVDAEGTFRLDVPGGSYTVVISAPGYLEQKKQVKVASGDRAIFNVELHPR